MPAFKPIQAAVITLWTEDVPATVHFYRDVIGLTLTHHHERQPTFDLQNGTFLVILPGKMSIAQEIDASLFPQIAFSVDSLEDALKQFQRYGVELVQDEEEDFGTRWVMFRDPGGNLIEFVQFDKINIRQIYMQTMQLSRKMIYFIIIWFGQTISLIGSGLTSFALGVWVFQRTGSVTQFALIGLSGMLPRVILSPLAGALIDRWDRRRAMLVSDAGSGISGLLMVLLLLQPQPQLWQIYGLVFISAAFNTLHWPAYSTLLPLLIPRENLGRANGMVQFGQAAAEILAPGLGGLLVLSIKLQGIVMLDCLTFSFAVLTLLLARFPQTPLSAGVRAQRGSFWQEVSLGWKYIAARAGLSGLLGFFTLVNFLWGMVGAILAPMILSFSNSQTLGLILSCAGGGMFAGSLAMSLWGGPRPRINGVLAFELLSGFCFILMGARPSIWPIAAGAFIAHFTIAIVFGSNQAIWQSKVPGEIQGRVFAIQQMTLRGASLLAFLAAGPLVEKVFQPLLNPQGALVSSLGQVVGSGAGRGIGLLLIVMGCIKVGVALAGYSRAPIRKIEEDLPDTVPG